jgi:secreted PhoX family phosphatase
MASRVSRRGFLAGSASFVALVAALQAQRAGAAARRSQFVEGPYGPLQPAADLATGLPLILLPEGFQYRTYSWAGDPMTNGALAPGLHDGMGVVATKGRGDNLEVTLIRNHERAKGEPILAPSRYDKSGRGDDDILPAGGTTTLVFRGREFVGVEPSLGGTIYNCAGGVTPWGTWLSCEETVIDLTPRGGQRHGYVFEVQPDAAATTAKPLIAMGRMKHEAVAVDPVSKVAYLTEDNPGTSCFYRFIPTDASGVAGSYEAGGRLQAPRVAGRPNLDLRRPALEDSYRLEWIDIEHPDADPGNVFSTRTRAGDSGSGPYLQAQTAGGIRLSKCEGICHRDGKFYVVDSNAGVDALDRLDNGFGAIWEVDPGADTMRAAFVAGRRLVADNIDNICVSPRGGLLLCEDGHPVVDRYGPGTRMIGITEEGKSFAFAKNVVSLHAAQVAKAGKRVAPRDYRPEEWAGCCFDANGEVLFVNLQLPGITFAIWGPWERGNL